MRRGALGVLVGLGIMGAPYAGAVAASTRAAPQARVRASADPLCTGSYGGAAPRVGRPLRFGVDPGLAGSVGGAQLPSTPDDVARDIAATVALRPPGKILVARLNRLFWSDGEAGIARFRGLVDRYTGAGIEVELQVRYHPTSAEDGDLRAWEAWVRHVVDRFGANRRVVAMTITNEVNLSVSPNTSDGAYRDAEGALIAGVEAAHREALRQGFRQLRFGFTYAYRFSPPGDAQFFAKLAREGGPAFRAALGFVGLDFYPGTVYPPAMTPGDSYRADMAQALGTLRECDMPLAAIGSRVPIWITENGVPTGATVSAPAQAAALSELVQAAHDYSATFNVTDYRWFNLRDAKSSAPGSLPVVAATFGTDGLLADDYAPKPSFAAYRSAIARLGASSPGPSAPRCRRLARRVALPPQRRPIIVVDIYAGRHWVAHARGKDLRSVRLLVVPRRGADLRVVL